MPKFLTKQLILFLALGLIIAGLSGTTYYFYDRFQKTQQILQNPSEATKIETQKIISDVGKLIALPTDEEPTIITVVDKEKLKDQPFFANVQNGDKVLIYTKAKKAILYRSSINKIIEVAPLNIGDSQQGQGQTIPQITPVPTRIPKPTSVLPTAVVLTPTVSPTGTP